MALFKKLKESINNAFTVPESALIGKGTPGQAVVLAVRPGVASEPIGGVPERVCVFMLEVQIGGTEPYRVEISQRVPETEYRSVQPGTTTYTVWVDPEDNNHVEIDLTPKEEE